MKILKEIAGRMGKMSGFTYLVLKVSLIYSCIIALAALIIFLYIGTPGADTYKIYLSAKELATLPAAVLFIAAIGSVCCEDMAMRLK